MLILSVFSCRTAKQINKAIAPKDSTITTVVMPNQSLVDSLARIKKTMDNLHQNYINFKTFNAKIRAEYQDNRGKQPDVTAIVRIVKDSAIWISLSASLLNIEIYRALITPDSVILLDKRNKEVQYRSLDYLQEVTQIPFDFKTLQELLIGNPVFMDSNIVYYKRNDNQVLISTSINKFSLPGYNLFKVGVFNCSFLNQIDSAFQNVLQREFKVEIIVGISA